MRQVRTVLSTYASDSFGVCSALYELGGMIVMHDASGCNSTYTTHDEPRWYHTTDSVFVSGLTELEAVLGEDEKIKNDMVAAIQDVCPAFAAIVGTPIPMMTGFDYDAIAEEVTAETGVPCFGFPTSGMRTYLCGVSEALALVAEKLTLETDVRLPKTVNILGATPLDFSLGGTVESTKKWLTENGWQVRSCWAMGSSLIDLSLAGEASVNLVISGSGMRAAKMLKQKFGTPYVVGTPVGKQFSDRLLKILKQTETDGIERISFDVASPDPECQSFLIGDSVISRSIAAAMQFSHGYTPKVICPLEPLESLEGILTPLDYFASEEDEIEELCGKAQWVMADPMYRPILPEGCSFFPLPHEAFSGRIFQKDVPDLLKFTL